MPRRNEHWEALFVTLLMATVCALALQVIIDGKAPTSELASVFGLLAGKGALIVIGLLVGLCAILLFVNFWRVWATAVANAEKQ